jgi:hypothetical protein
LAARLLWAKKMFREIIGVRDAILARSAVRDITLELITQVFTGVTSVDKIIYVRYNTPPENPIWGEFTRWTQQPGVYHGFESIVEIRYAEHLLAPDKVDWLRFIICKELCHSLHAASGSHDVSQPGMDNLVAAFSLLSAGEADTENWRSGDGIIQELVAMAGAMELLCPIAERKKIVAAQGQPDDAAILHLAREFQVPAFYMKVAFGQEHMEVIGSMLGA